ncbi:uncharacterized protein EAF01_007954 [Botrytis porri]|uniref:uncharacterized protein n=1 Tax=Botrytis porri TaxID=87229 RepID=UPI00190121FE|nr:uncharacterized protein EAF01_007954 [Botrytis porri]KAF7900652.1 hypothetical protein EAF01_007954 [Botrytis porri]
MYQQLQICAGIQSGRIIFYYRPTQRNISGSGKDLEKLQHLFCFCSPYAYYGNALFKTPNLRLADPRWLQRKPTIFKIRKKHAKASIVLPASYLVAARNTNSAEVIRENPEKPAARSAATIAGATQNTHFNHIVLAHYSTLTSPLLLVMSSPPLI